MGKLTRNGPFSMAMLNNQKGILIYWNHSSSDWIHSSSWEISARIGRSSPQQTFGFHDLTTGIEHQLASLFSAVLALEFLKMAKPPWTLVFSTVVFFVWCFWCFFFHCLGCNCPGLFGWTYWVVGSGPLPTSNRWNAMPKQKRLQWCGLGDSSRFLKTYIRSKELWYIIWYII